jgi:hypothetical protein
VHRLPSLISCLGEHPGVFALVRDTNAERAREIRRTTKIGDAMQKTQDIKSLQFVNEHGAQYRIQADWQQDNMVGTS